MSQKNNRNVTEKSATTAFIAVLAVIILILIIVVVIMLCSRGTGNGDNSTPSGDAVTDHPIASDPLNDEIALPELKIDSIEERDNAVLITTSYCTMSYPSAYHELIAADVYYGDGTGCIIFSAITSVGNQTAYSLLFNNESGNEIGKLKLDGVDEAIRVSVVFYPAPETLSGEELTNYYAAQETFNDIVVSLEKNEGFSSSN